MRPWFTPEYGDALSHRVAKFLGRARQRIRIASPVLTSGPILATLVEIVNEHRCDVAGVIDETQVDEVFHQWATNGVSAWKIPLLNTVLTAAPFSGKPSTRWTPESLHDFMHAKIVVADDVVFVGSFNFSRSGERNAENVLEIHDAGGRRPSRDLRRRGPGAVPAHDAAPDRGLSGARPAAETGCHEDRHRRQRCSLAAVAATAALRESPLPPGEGCPVFPADNAWNRRVDSLPVAPGSAATIAAIGPTKTMHADFGSGLWDGGPIGIPITVVGKGQPKSAVTVRVRGRVGPRARTRSRQACRSRAEPAADGDRHALIVDRDACRLYELYALRRVGGRWTAGSGAIWNLRSNRLRPAGWTSADAAGLPILPGPRPLRRGRTRPDRPRAPLHRLPHASRLRLAGAPLRELADRSGAAADGRPAAAEARASTSRASRGRRGSCSGAEGVRDDRGRQRLGLVRLRRARSALVERRPAHSRARCRARRSRSSTPRRPSLTPS